MEFELNRTIEILERTPLALEQLLSGLSEEWTANNEGPDTWSPFDIMGHLIHGEKTDWIPRLHICLQETQGTFTPFDRFAQFDESKGKTMADLLQEFKYLRATNLALLRAANVQLEDLDRKAAHPDLGEVTLRNLLSTWAVHDLGHIAQISRVMAKQYSDEVGPWKAYIPILSK